MKEGLTIILALPIVIAVLGWFIAIKRKGHRVEITIIVGFGVVCIISAIDHIVSETYPPDFTEILFWELALSPAVLTASYVTALIYRRFKRRTVE